VRRTYAALPSAMRSAKRWLVWRQAGTRKIPFYTNGRLRGKGCTLDSPKDVAALAGFEEALSALSSGAYTGLGFALGRDGGGWWQGIDLDRVSAHPGLMPLCFRLPGYTERSPSGDGVHAIGFGDAFETVNVNEAGIEAYCRRRYLTVTGDFTSMGDRLGSPGPVEDLSGFVRSILLPYAGLSPRPPPGRPQALLQALPADSELVAALKSALGVLDASDYSTSIRQGQRLRCLGRVGFELWRAWRATSSKFNEEETRKKWGSLSGSHTGYAAIFREAQNAGWLNPGFTATAHTLAQEEFMGAWRLDNPVGFEADGTLTHVLHDSTANTRKEANG
jgi:hypothetical protein